MEKALLLIDDSTDHLGILDVISNHLNDREGIRTTYFHVNPLDRKYWNENRDPELESVVKGIQVILSGYKPGLIVVDQYYPDVNFKGLSVIEKLREIPKFKSCPIFLISGKREKIVREIFEDRNIAIGDKVNELSKIILLRISRFLDKGFKDEAIEVLKIKSIEEILPEKLREFEPYDVKINRFSPQYNVLSFRDLADKIENRNDESSSILNEMFDLTLAHYSEINEKL